MEKLIIFVSVLGLSIYFGFEYNFDIGLLIFIILLILKTIQFGVFKIYDIVKELKKEEL